MPSALGMTRRPTSPGEILHEEFLVPLGETQGGLAARLGVDIETINRVVNGRTRATAVLAIKLAEALQPTPESKIHYRVEHNRSTAISVSVAVPGERWEIDFDADGSNEVERFESTGTIDGDQALDELFARFSD